MSGTALAPVEGRRDGVPGTGVVPWATVLPLAVALTYADGFWLVALRGATGSVARTQTPFTSWLHESTLALPLFVLAVLGVLTLAGHWFGPAPRTLRRLAATALLLTAAGTLAGAALLAANAAYDYHLQVAQLGMMGTMGGTCVGSCTDIPRHAAAGLQLRTVGLGVPILLLTSLLAVAWVLALRGGGLVLARPARAAHGPGPSPLLAASLLAGGVLHAFVVPEHLAEWPTAGAFFVLLAGAQLALAALARWQPGRSPTPAAPAAAVVVSAGALALWLVSRTVGMPLGPEPGTAEAVGLIDVVCCVLELVTLVVAARLLAARGRDHAAGAIGLAAGPVRAALAGRLAVVAVVAITALGLAGSDLAGVGVVVDPSMTMSSR